MQVIAVLLPPPGFDLDDNAIQEGVSTSPMYMEPFISDHEVSVNDLLARLRNVSGANTMDPILLEPSHTAEVILRTSRNIFYSVQASHRSAIGGNGHGGRDYLRSMFSFPKMESAFYGALWASLLFGRSADGDGPVEVIMQRRNFLPHIVEHFETHFSTDITLIERYIVPLFQSPAESAQLRESIRLVRVVDSLPKQIKSRTKEISNQVRYKVGQVFQHKRYHYTAVIIGWDLECGANEHWMTQMLIHELRQGRYQSFYHVLWVKKSSSYSPLLMICLQG
jgi:F-box protein 21